MQCTPIKKIRVYPSGDARPFVRGGHRDIAVLTIRTLLAARAVEVAMAGIVFRGLPLAISTRLKPNGTLAVEVSLGDGRMTGRLVRERDLRTATVAAESKARIEARKRRDAQGFRRT